eukprot:CAMPEP_0168755696 /NCGR_PEP_ID=MMETSP0724-20121128/20209_1 /TAXON_ID=265536 /ORGANISM="Amphiprora sp., Strain CCMP467" /LENGTH=422 /DNA_ID=CAMNT_0008804333 /DNA_START=87 /DNA_END=1356 /DNA_ORIENTATION=+
MSLCAMIIMGVLFLSETWAFASTRIATSIVLDENEEPQIRLNFNITLLDLHCDYVSVDVWDALGTNRQNVTKNVDKWQLDEAGARRIFSGRNREAREVKHEEHENADELQGHAVELTKQNFPDFMKEHDMAFVDMFDPGAFGVNDSHPPGKSLPKRFKKKREQKIMAFPTLRWYHAGQAVQPDYKMDRTVQALVAYAKRKLEMDEKYKEWFSKNEHQTTPEEQDKKRQLYQQQRPEHPGCQVSGHLMVNRVPGNFHIEAKSKSHNLNAAMTNLSHVVNHLSFGPPIDLNQDRKARRILKQVPEEHRQFSPMDDSDYVTKQYHQAFHHYIKVVSTHLNMGTSDTNSLLTYQFLEQSQIVYYSEVNVPEARFSYDLSPMSVVVEKEGRKWYDYLTSLCAIIGGTFTTLGLIDATLYKVFKPKKL